MDAVFTWVDGSDPSHRAKRLEHAEEGNHLATVKQATHDTRFSNNGELWYALHLARQNLPWLDTIFLVTDAQRPDWLDYGLARQLKVRVIDHKEIFQGYETYLPTFNSRSIEAMLWRIPGLSEQFIYFNDDVLVLRPQPSENYFSEGKPRFRGCWVRRNRLLKKLEKLFNLRPRGLVGRRAEVDKLNLHRFFSLAHAPYPLRRSMLRSVFGSEHELTEHIKHRFRHMEQVWPIGYAANRGFMDNAALTGPYDWAYIDPAKENAETTEKELERIQNDASVASVCVQSLDAASPAMRARIDEVVVAFQAGKNNAGCAG